MKGEIDTSFETLQRDLFASGMAATIGMNAFGVWIAIKAHADHETGECWPGMRRLESLTGLSHGTVQKSIKVLVDANLLRIVTMGSGKRSTQYVARERLDVRLGDRVLCTIVVDYVPSTLRKTLSDIKQALKTGKSADRTFAECDIIPGSGFEWDDKRHVLRASIPHDEMGLDAPPEDEFTLELTNDLTNRVRELQTRSQAKKLGR